MKTQYINHVAIVIDESSSMSHLKDRVVEQVDNQVKHLATRSKELGQETRVSLYLFNCDARCIVYDMDVLRLPSLRDIYAPSGMTALVDASLLALSDLGKMPELYADHAFLVYVITDGGENNSRSSKAGLFSTVSRLPENYTVATFVPNAEGHRMAVALGFPAGNISIWDASSKAGLDKAADVLKQSTDNYMTMRAKGVRSTKNLFVAQVAAKRTEVVQKLKPVTNPYTCWRNTKNQATPIKDFVEKHTGQAYMVGSAFYQLVKTETIQSHKRICLRTIPDGRLLSGSLDEVRKVLCLPTGGDIKVTPGDFKDFQVFVESTSVNRNVVPGQEVLVMKL